MKDSPAACATLGINLTFTKLAVFSISAALAGVAGAFYGGLRGQVGPSDFEFLNSLALLLLVSIAGINTVGGALAGGLTFGVFPKLQQEFPRLRNLAYTFAGLGALGIARNSNGWTNELAPIGAFLRRVALREPDERQGGPGAPGQPEEEGEGVRELAGVGG
jgi:branched-chain amino acid transport system permease protein